MKINSIQKDTHCLKQYQSKEFLLLLGGEKKTQQNHREENYSLPPKHYFITK